MLKKAKLYSLLAIMVASTIVGLFGFSSTTSAQSASGGTVVYIDPGLEKDVKTKAWRAAMLSCLRAFQSGSELRQIPSSELKNGDWFSNLSGEDKNVGYHVEPTNGHYTCDEDGFVSGFVNYFGWTNPFVAACSLGFVPANNTDATYQECIDSDSEELRYRYERSDRDDGEQIAFATDAIDGQVTYTTDSGQLGNAQMYVLYLRNFQIACATNPSSPLTSVTPGDTETYLPVMVDNGKGETTTVYYDVNDADVDDEKNLRRTSVDGQGSNQERTCRQLSEAIDEESDPYVSAYSDYVKQLELTDEEIAEGSGSVAPGGEEGTATCRVDGIGWIVCPVVNLMAKMVDDSYYLLDNSLLRTPAISLDTDAPLYKAWKLMRDFANVAFVLIFMFIIFSQITSYGISNYGIKQLLPKLIIAAILVNLSYIICALAVDASNLIGSELKGFFDNLAASLDADTDSGPFRRKEADDGSGKAGIIGWGTIAGSVLIAASLGGGILAVLALLIPFLFAALGAVIATVLTLIIRQALIIILIFVAPLAFVALLLPNTEGYFKSWRKLFQSLLLLYPVIALVFGGSALASTIIMAAAESSSDGNSLGEGLGGMTQTLLQLSGAAVSVVPLFIVPTVIKVAGGALNRFAGIVNNPNKGPIDWARNRSTKGVERMQKDQASNAFEKGPRGGFRGRTADFVSGRSKYFKDSRMKSDDSNRDSELALQEAGFNATEAVAAGEREGASAADIRRGARAQSTLDRMDTQAVDDAITLIKRGQTPETLLQHSADQLVEANTSGDSVTARAAAKILTQNGSAGNKILDETIQSMIDNGGLHKDVDSDLRTSLIGSKPTNNAREQWALGVKDKNGDIMYKDIASAYTKKTVDSLTAQELASQKDYVLDEYQKNGAISPEVAQNVLDAEGGNFSLTEANKKRFQGIAGSSKPPQGSTANSGSSPASSTAPTSSTSSSTPPAASTSSPQQSGGAAPANSAPSTTPPTGPTPPSTNSTPSAPAASTPQSTPTSSDNWGSRPRDWSGYSQPAGTGMPTQTESPTFTPGQPSASSTPTPTSSSVSGGRQRDWSGYDSGSSATAEAVEKVAKELKGVANKLGDSPTGSTPVSAPTPTSTPAPAVPQPPSSPTINGGRQRDWSGYGGTPMDTGAPTQTESPTYRPRQE